MGGGSGPRPGRGVRSSRGFRGRRRRQRRRLGHARSHGPRRPGRPRGRRYDGGPEAADLGATSMIDISDGLVADLRHVADASGVLVDIETARLPGDPALRSAAAALGTDWLRWMLTGGEDHALAATFPPGTHLPGRWTVIGEVRRGGGVAVDSRPPDGLGGWTHFPRRRNHDE